MNGKPDLSVALLLSCYSFESFFGAVLGLDRDGYLRSYRNDWSWYYAKGLIDNGIKPILYVPSMLHEGLFETDIGVGVRFLRLAPWFRPIAQFGRAMRATRWSLYAQERINAAAIVRQLNHAIDVDLVGLLYVQEYWGGRFDHLVPRVRVPIAGADHGGVAKGVVKHFKPLNFRRAGMLTCQTPDECAVVERYGGRPTLLPNGCDVGFFVPPAPGTSRQKTIVTVARLTNKQKRTSDLIHAMQLLSDDWTLQVVGTGPDYEALVSLAAEIGVSSRVTFHGFKSQAEIRSFNQQCGVYAMPSANEAVCLAVLEAMSCGAAIVVSRIRGSESLVSDGVNGILFPVGNVPALAQAIETAWRERDRLGLAATNAVAQRFNASLLYRQLTEGIRALVRPSPELVAGRSA